MSRSLPKHAASRARAVQAADQLAWEGEWGNALGLLFTDATGAPLNVNNDSDHFRRLTKRAGVRPIRPHDCRHTCASLAIAAGVPIFTISKRLGHATIAQTMDTYAHLLPQSDAEAATLFEGHLYRAS